MIIRLMNNHSATTPFTSKWVDMSPEMKGRNEKVVSLQISWHGLTGIFSGYLILEGSNDMTDAGYKRTYEINTADNYDNSEIIVIRQVFKYFRLTYVPLGIASGSINSHLYYK